MNEPWTISREVVVDPPETICSTPLEDDDIVRTLMKVREPGRTEMTWIQMKETNE